MNQAVRNILTVDDIDGAQPDTRKMPYPMKVQLKNMKIPNKNPLFGGPKYDNKNLIDYEKERSKNTSKSRLNS